MTAAIVAPMCAYTLMLLALGGFLGYVRISGAFGGRISMEYIRVREGARPADWIVDLHHHYANQFEVPVLFYLGCLTAFASQSVVGVTVGLAWTFVGLRLLHTGIVLAGNNPLLRVGPFLLSALVVAGIWGNVFLQVVA